MPKKMEGKMNFCRLQFGCLLIVIYITLNYLRECKKYQKRLDSSIFDEMLVLVIISIILDGITAVTVNHLDVVNPILNKILHMLYLISLDTIIYITFGFFLKSVGGTIQKKTKVLLSIPYIIFVLIVVLNIGSLEFKQGKYANYSMGISAYTCFATVIIYLLFMIFVIVKKWQFIDGNKRTNILTFLICASGIAILQGIFPEILMTSVIETLFVICIYLNQEDPIYTELSKYHNEMVTGFSTLVESKDGSTGGHIRRTTAYVNLLAKELSNRGLYKDILTKDYIENLCKAAPMHDIGKIGVPDVVLQKPGRLNEEEYEIIKKHAPEGGRIINETFFHLGNKEYSEIAFQVANYHHEKWNGKGYPEGLSQKDIPLCARIMTVADVFDAVSEKRCYRDAMPLDKCFEIIKNGSGQDFDPVVAEVFLDIRKKVEAIYNEINHET